VRMKVATRASAYTQGYEKGQEIAVPVAHHDGNYTIDAEGLARLQGEDLVAFTYAEPVNGAMGDIAGVLSENRRVLGMMPHPERAFHDWMGGADGRKLLEIWN